MHFGTSETKLGFVVVHDPQLDATLAALLVQFQFAPGYFVHRVQRTGPRVAGEVTRNRARAVLLCANDVHYSTSLIVLVIVGERLSDQ